MTVPDFRADAVLSLSGCQAMIGRTAGRVASSITTFNNNIIDIVEDVVVDSVTLRIRPSAERYSATEMGDADAEFTQKISARHPRMRYS